MPNIIFSADWSSACELMERRSKVDLSEKERKTLARASLVYGRMYAETPPFAFNDHQLRRAAQVRARRALKYSGGNSQDGYATLLFDIARIVWQEGKTSSAAAKILGVRC